MSVTDMVASKSLKTPTAVADFLIDCFAKAENYISELSSEITDLSRIIIEKNRNRLEETRIKLIPLATIMMAETRENLTTKIINIINIGKACIVKSGLTPANQESRLITATRLYSSGKGAMIVRMAQNLAFFTSNALTKTNVRLTGLESNLSILDPVSVLMRGFTVTSLNGMIMKKGEQLNIDDIIDTQFSDGVVKSRVMKKIKDKS